MEGRGDRRDEDAIGDGRRGATLCAVRRGPDIGIIPAETR
jgi:hypothetical protein